MVNFITDGTHSAGDIRNVRPEGSLLTDPEL